ncbi:hypothetical protein L227DRAFT_503634 [Lentinus tigrinus ALCF2SS1-6]|uniref:Uncharacterized protein n=1 Tax=Lentinus tigrinus ALCF2SS1-6 TaxID=1328759 RepID=A0A5C2S8P0_9APHY|nr:hypothetical protein L227DRAFT_503634 [Lentinus tigrinus ALCF2SS1-6]
MIGSRTSHLRTEAQQTKWKSYVYAFYKPDVDILKVSPTKISHVFHCAKPGCTTTVTWFLDTKDAMSTANLGSHVASCWSVEVMCVAQELGHLKHSHPMVEAYGRSGTITMAFKCTGKGKVMYSVRPHTSAETRCRPFEIVRDRAFLMLMKTGRPEYKIPSPATISRDMRRVFAKVRVRIAKMLQDFDGDLSFTCNAWTSPYHKALVAFGVHLHHHREPLSFILNVVEIAESHTGEALVKAFEETLTEFEIEDKVSIAHAQTQNCKVTHLW